MSSPPANNPANALIMRRTTCKYLPIGAAAALADARLDVPATDNNADAAADASLAGVVLSMVPPPMDNNADDVNADASLAGVVASMEAPPADNNADAANADAAALVLEAPPDNTANAVADNNADAANADAAALVLEAPPDNTEMQEQLVGDMGVLAVSPF